LGAKGNCDQEEGGSHAKGRGESEGSYFLAKEDSFDKRDNNSQGLEGETLGWERYLSVILLWVGRKG